MSNNDIYKSEVDEEHRLKPGRARLCSYVASWWTMSSKTCGWQGELGGTRLSPVISDWVSVNTMTVHLWNDRFKKGLILKIRKTIKESSVICAVSHNSTKKAWSLHVNTCTVCYSFIHIHSCTFIPIYL